MNKKNRIFILISFLALGGLYLPELLGVRSRANVLAQLYSSPEDCLVGHEAPMPKEYKWELVKTSENPNCQNENGGLRCRYPVNPSGTLGAEEIIERICEGNPPPGICPVHTKGCTSLRIGPKTGKQAIKLQGLLKKEAAGYNFTIGNIIVSKNPPLTNYINQTVYSAAPNGSESIPVEKSLHLWKLSEKDKRILAKVNKYLPIIAERNIEKTEQHEQEHWKIMDRVLPSYLNVINNLSLFSLGPFSTIEQARKEIISSITKRLVQEREKENNFHNQLDREEKLNFKPAIIPDTEIECDFARDYVFKIMVTPGLGGIKGSVDIVPKSLTQNFWKNTEVTLTAKAEPGYNFKKWETLSKSDYCPCDGQINPVCKFILQRDVYCVAIFK